MEVVKQFVTLQAAIQAANVSLTFVPSKSIVVDIDDTLIFDDGRSTVNRQVLDFVNALASSQYKVHIVTARSKGIERATKLELMNVGVNMKLMTLDIAPEKSRGSMTLTSEWKFSMREKYGPVALSIGDQWTDIVKVSSDDDLGILDTKFPGPWVLVKPNDGITSYGLKLASLS